MPDIFGLAGPKLLPTRFSTWTGLIDYVSLTS